MDLNNIGNEVETPFDLFGFEISSGWMGLVQPILNEIKHWNETNPDKPQIKIFQIKEKFGELRFYADNCPDYIDDMISKAERESHKICERCGSATNVTTKGPGWITTLCDDCRNAPKKI